MAKVFQMRTFAFLFCVVVFFADEMRIWAVLRRFKSLFLFAC